MTGAIRNAAREKLERGQLSLGVSVAALLAGVWVWRSNRWASEVRGAA